MTQGRGRAASAANQRVIPDGYGMQLSNSWAAPERGERLAELAGSGKHDSRSVIAMQYDQTTTFAAKLKKVFALILYGLASYMLWKGLRS